MALQRGSIWGSIGKLFGLTDIAAAETLVGSFLGDDLYRKVLTVAAGPDGMTPVSTAHGITGLAKIVAIEGGLTNDTAWIPIAGGGDLVLTADDTNVDLDSTTDYSGYAGEIVLLYTKA